MLKVIDGIMVRWTITKASGGWAYKVSTPRFGRDGWVAGYKRDAQAVVERASVDLVEQERRPQYECPLCGVDCSGECDSNNWDRDRY
jgi:hypothetical protein